MAEITIHAGYHNPWAVHIDWIDENGVCQITTIRFDLKTDKSRVLGIEIEHLGNVEVTAKECVVKDK